MCQATQPVHPEIVCPIYISNEELKILLTPLTHQSQVGEVHAAITSNSSNINYYVKGLHFFKNKERRQKADLIYYGLLLITNVIIAIN